MEIKEWCRAILSELQHTSDTDFAYNNSNYFNSKVTLETRPISSVPIGGVVIYQSEYDNTYHALIVKERCEYDYFIPVKEIADTPVISGVMGGLPCAYTGIIMKGY